VKSSYRCVLIATAALVAGSCTRHAEAPKPRLIVQITFDQLRGDLLERYRPAFTGGFKRVLDEGWWAQQGDAAHGLTVSFPGHATLATGMFPSHHGLTANEWWQEVDGRWRSVSVVEDKRYKMASGGTGVSLWQMTASTLADWVKAASPQSRTVAIGSDSAIVYGGKRPDAMFWFDPEAGGYTTSTYYGARRPAWIAALNRQLADLPREWALQVPPQWRSLATHAQRCPAFEAGRTWSTDGRMLGPHRYNPGGADTPDKHLSWLGGTPFADEALLRQIPAIVRAEQLGRDNTPDYLAISIGATDSVGHEYGAVSLEQLDDLMRLDRALGAMLDGLDKTVGRGRYVVAISADHGVADPPEERCIHRVNGPEIEALLDRVERIARAHSGIRAALIDKIVAELKRAPFVGDVYTEARLSSTAPDDWRAELMKRSFRPGHTTDFPLWSEKPRPFHPARYGIAVQFKPGVTFQYARAVHGSPYAYDRLVPVLFYGAGVPHRIEAKGGRTVDVAPTLAALGGIRTPPGLDGRTLIDREDGR
jgi:predicted AlkP superfamily pyrophosphatase or phosphodiesterase